MKLSEKIHGTGNDRVVAPYYSSGKGWLAKSPRLMVRPMILKHRFDLWHERIGEPPWPPPSS